MVAGKVLLFLLCPKLLGSFREAGGAIGFQSLQELPSALLGL